MRKALYTIFTLLLLSPVLAKDLQMNIFYGNFYAPGSGPYIETYFSVYGPSLHFKNEKNKYSAGVKILLTFSQEGNIKSADKFIIGVNDLADTLQAGTYTQQIRTALPKGTYKLALHILDLNNPDTSSAYKLSQDVEVFIDGSISCFSDIQIIDAYAKAAENDPFAKSGISLIPVIPQGDYFFNEKQEKLTFYTEFYLAPTNTADKFLLKYYLENTLTNRVLTAFAGQKVESANEVNPLLVNLNIAQLPSGSYNLKVEAISKDGTLMGQKGIFFFRSNPTLDQNTYVFKDLDLSSEFASLQNSDSLKYYIKTIWPISTQQERRVGESQIENGDLQQMQNFFYSFWTERNLHNPWGEWKAYLKEVNYVNERYSTSAMLGYRTDRGRVYLQYGKPDLVEDLSFDNTKIPHEIWQYNQLQSASTRDQVNKIFVFANRNRAVNTMELLHSTASGEITNTRWNLELTPGIYQSDDRGIRSGDPYGSRTMNNSIINSGTRERSVNYEQTTPR